VNHPPDEDLDFLLGQRIVAVDLEAGTLTLSNDNKVQIETTHYDCCSFIDLVRLATTDNVITAAGFGDDEDETGGEGSYSAWIYVVTDDGAVIHVADAEGNASNGYYLHGFALSVELVPGE
jgi:hypothetical protein